MGVKRRKQPVNYYAYMAAMDTRKVEPVNGVVDFGLLGAAVGKELVPIPRGRRATLVKSPETKAFMEYVGRVARLYAPAIPWDGAVSLEIRYQLAVTPGWSAEKKALALRGKLFCIKKPDGDNVSKAIGDALSKVIYADDCQIVDYRILKSYGERPNIRIIVRNLEQVAEQTELF